MPATEFEQPARRIGGGGRGRLGLAVWAGALAGIVGIGVLGRPGDGDPTDESVAAVSASPPRTEKAEPVLVLTEPTTQEVTTIAVYIRGRVAEQVRRVQIFLRVGRAAAASQIVRPTSNGLFGAVFTLPGPRSAGEAAIRAVGLDGFGMPLGSVNRSFSLSALTALTDVPSITPRPGRPSRPKLGEDGVMGGLTLDPPRSTPRPDAGLSFLIGQLGWRTNSYQR